MSVVVAVTDFENRLEANRKWLFAGTFLQIELIAVVAWSAISLMMESAPRAAHAPYLALLAAAILLPIAKAVSQGNPAAGIVVGCVYAFRMLHLASYPPEILAGMSLLVAVEGVFLGRALHAMTKTPPLPRHRRGRKVLATVALILLVGHSLTSHVGPAAYGDARAPHHADRIGLEVLLAVVILAALHGVHHQLRGVFGGRLHAERPTDTIDSSEDSTAKAPAAITPLELVFGGVVFGLSLLVWIWIWRLSRQPGAMLTVSMLILPLAGVLYLPMKLAAVWISKMEHVDQSTATSPPELVRVPLLVLLGILALLAVTTALRIGEKLL